MADQLELAGGQTREKFDAEVRENFKWNGPLGIIQGVTLYMDEGLRDAQVVIPSFLYALTGSNTYVGLASTLQLFAHSVPALFGVSLVEHLPIKKKAMLIFGWLSAACWAIIAVSTFFLPRSVNFYIFLTFQATSFGFYGLYLLVWQDIMSKIIPVERRGNYFGFRNFLATMSTAGGVAIAGYILTKFSFPANYSITFLASFILFAAALLILAQTREAAAWRTTTKESPWAKLKKMPVIFREDQNFLRYCCIRSVGMAFFSMSSPFYILFAQQRLAGSDAGMLIGYLGTTSAVARAAGNLLWGAVAQKHGYKLPFEASYAIFALTAFMTLFSSSFPMFVAIYIIHGLGMAASMQGGMNMLMEFGQIQNRTTYIGISSVISGIVGGFSPLIGGFLADHLGYKILFMVTATICVLVFAALRRYVVDPRFVQAYKE